MLITSALTAEQRIHKAIVDIMANPKYIALSGILMVGKRTLMRGMPTAATNGRDEVYGIEFVDGLSDAELRFVILHENYHKLYRHLHTWQHLWKENPILANMACDYVINIKLADDNTDEWAKMPTDRNTNKAIGLVDPKYRGWDSAMVFNDLKQNAPGGGGGNNNASKGGSGGSESEAAGSMDQHDWEGAKEMSQAEADELARDIDCAIRQGALAAGTAGSGGDRLFGELLEPEVRWQDVLQQFINSLCSGRDFSTWARPSRRYMPYGLYMPSGMSERVGGCVIAIDTSGSIGQSDLTKMMSEVRGMLDAVRPEWVRVLYWDTAVCQDEHYEGNELDGLVDTTKPAGGGGTYVECVPAYMAENGIGADFAIIFTDGYLGGSWGAWPCKTIWCILDHSDASPTNGTVVHIRTSKL